MRDAFPGYFDIQEKDFKRIWKESIITPDANVLLNLYKYSEQTTNDFFKIFKSIEGRIWITHKAGHEFFDNRLNEISKHEREYDDFLKGIENIQKGLESSKKHPFLNRKLVNEIKEIFEKTKKELDKSKNDYRRIIREDPIKEKLAELFENKVGREYEKEDLEKIYKKGNFRYENRIPPGFCDEGKNPNFRKYGDLIIWEQIIEKAKNDGKDIIFITDERKKDWWLKYEEKDEIISPHPFLIKEFKERTQRNIIFYSSEKFMEIASKEFNEEINKKTINEIKESKIEKIRKKKLMLDENLLLFDEYKIKNDIIKMRHVREDIAINLHEIEKEINKIEEIIIILNKKSAHEILTESEEENLQHYKLLLSRMKKRRLSLESKLADIDAKLNDVFLKFYDERR